MNHNLLSSPVAGHFGYFAFVHVYRSHVCLVPTEIEKVSDPLAQELWTAAGPYMGAGTEPGSPEEEPVFSG